MSSNKDNIKHVRCVVMGKTGSGKSSFANILLGKNRFMSDPCGSSVTTEPDVDEGYFRGSAIKIVDTPGFFDTNVDKDRNEKEIIQSLLMSEPGPNLFFYCISIASRFTEEDAESFRRAKEIFGNYVTKHMVIVFTNKDRLDKAGKTVKEYQEKAPSELKQVLEEVKNYKPVFIDSTSSNLESGLDPLSKIIKSVNVDRYYTSEKYEKGIRSLKKIAKDRQEYKHTFTQWKEKRNDIISQFSNLETYLNDEARGVRIKKLAGSALGIAGSAVAIGGIIAIPFTLGASLAATAIGANITTTGGLLRLSAEDIDTIITKKHKNEIDALLEEDSKRLEKLSKAETDFKETISEIFSNDAIKAVVQKVLKISIFRSGNKSLKEKEKQGFDKVRDYLHEFLNLNTIETPVQNESVDDTSDSSISLVPIISLPNNLATIIVESFNENINREHLLSNIIFDVRLKLENNMKDRYKDQNVLDIFVDEVENFRHPKIHKE